MGNDSKRATDQDLSLAPGMADGAAHESFGGADAVDDRSEPVGSSDVDADRVASGVDPELVGDQGARSPREAMLGDYGVDDDATTDEGEPVGLADRDADVERSR